MSGWMDAMYPGPAAPVVVRKPKAPPAEPAIAPTSEQPFRRHSAEPLAFALMELLRSEGPMRRVDVCEHLGWTESRFRTAVAYAREHMCAPLGLAIPPAVPQDEFLYRLTGDWIGVDGSAAIEAGSSYAMGWVESRLRSIHRDVKVAVANTPDDTVHGRKARIIEKQIGDMFDALVRIDTPKRAVA